MNRRSNPLAASSARFPAKLLRRGARGLNLSRRGTTMSAIRILAILALAAGAAQAQSPPRGALDGIDPVLLIQGKEVQGKSEFKVSRARFDYLFASAENKAAFEKDPERYEIQL